MVLVLWSICGVNEAKRTREINCGGEEKGKYQFICCIEPCP